MSEIVDPQGQPIEAEEKPADQQESESQEIEVEVPELICGYLVGLKPDGKFVFEVTGQSTGLIELMGLHQYASHRIEVAKDVNQGYGPPLLAKQLSDIGSMLKVILNMLTQQQGKNLLK